jgi:hypothetical protein
MNQMKLYHTAVHTHLPAAVLSGLRVLCQQHSSLQVRSCASSVTWQQPHCIPCIEGPHNVLLLILLLPPLLPPLLLLLLLLQAAPRATSMRLQQQWQSSMPSTR